MCSIDALEVVSVFDQICRQILEQVFTLQGSLAITIDRVDDPVYLRELPQIRLAIVWREPSMLSG